MKRFFSLILISALLFSSAAFAEETKSTMEGYEPLWTLAEPYGFKMGACLSANQLYDKDYLNFLARHFNSVTMTNETKAYSMLDQRASKKSADGTPGISFSVADIMVKWAQQNNVAVRGHVLVWDAYMTDWFFREGYDSTKPYVDNETMRFRLKSYIEQVITHFEEKFPGVIYCWDVVNEAVADDVGERVPGNICHLRATRSGGRNLFYDHVGEDYVEYSFLCAKDTVEKLGADIKLFYNDYNMFYADKRNAAINLVHSINHYATDENGEFRTLIDGIGMQGYIGGYGTQAGCMNQGDLKSIRDSIRAYAAEGLQVQITEMAVRNFDQNKIDQHGAFYGSLFKVLRAINQNTEGAPLTAVCIWGVTDCPLEVKGSYTYNLNSPYGGLVTEKLAVKPAFEEVYKMLLGE